MSCFKLITYGLNIAIVIVFLAVFATIGWLNSKTDAVRNRNLIVSLDMPAFSGTTDSHEVVWEQPANTIFDGDVYIVCTETAHVASGNIGWRIGFTPGGSELWSSPYEILHAGTTVPKNFVIYTGPNAFSSRSNASPAAGLMYTAVKRKLYFAITHTTAATAPGKFLLNLRCMAAY